MFLYDDLSRQAQNHCQLVLISDSPASLTADGAGRTSFYIRVAIKQYPAPLVNKMMIFFTPVTTPGKTNLLH
jgi:hypothetical protein